jgi:uncharacterized protein (TIGR03382 family)
MKRRHDPVLGWLRVACAMTVSPFCIAASAEPSGRAISCKPGVDWVLPPAPSNARTDTFPELPRPCPTGQVPVSSGRAGPKGSPGKRSEVTSADGGVSYHYAGVYQFVPASGALGASVQWGQYQPTVLSADSHSLAEISVETSDSKQIAEVGWTVDPEYAGDTLPHLFVFHWVDGKPTCYDGCGWEQVSQTRYPGMIVTLTRDPQQVVFQYMNSAWWVWYQSEWIGFFPVDLWEADFASAGLIQWFAEVAGTQQPSSEMGDGVLAAMPNAAFMTNLQVESASGESEMALLSPSTVTDPGVYELSITEAGFSFGGPGYGSSTGCATCASLLANCGVLDDGCGHSLTCGTCLAPETCGGGGLQENVCALPDGGLGEVPWTGGYFDAGPADAGTAAMGSTQPGGSSGCSSSGDGGSIFIAAMALGLLVRFRKEGRAR